MESSWEAPRSGRGRSHGQIAVKELRLKEHVVEIKGRHVHVVFDTAQQTAKPLDWLETLNRLSDKQRKEVEKSVGNLEVDIEIELPSNSTEQDISSAMHAVFLMPGESMIEAVPDFWRGYFARLEGRKWNAPVPEGSAFRVGGGVSAPRVVYTPDPEYAEQARKAKYQGTEVLWLVVDPSGKPRDIQVQRPLGLGLDEKAVAAINDWKFEPARKNGEPVAVQINVEVSFRLY